MGDEPKPVPSQPATWASTMDPSNPNRRSLWPVQEGETPPDTRLSTPETGRTAAQQAAAMLEGWPYDESGRAAILQRIAAALTSAQEENAGLRTELAQEREYIAFMEEQAEADHRVIMGLHTPAALATARQGAFEECAKIADVQLAACGTLRDAEDPPYTEGKQDAYHDMAVRIRSRSASSPSTPPDGYDLNDEEHAYGRDPVKLAQLLAGRDDYLVEKGLFSDFVEWARHPQQPKPEYSGLGQTSSPSTPTGTVSDTGGDGDPIVGMSDVPAATGRRRVTAKLRRVDPPMMPE